MPPNSFKLVHAGAVMKDDTAPSTYLFLSTSAPSVFHPLPNHKGVISFSISVITLHNELSIFFLSSTRPFSSLRFHLSNHYPQSLLTVSTKSRKSQLSVEETTHYRPKRRCPRGAQRRLLSSKSALNWTKFDKHCSQTWTSSCQPFITHHRLRCRRLRKHLQARHLKSRSISRKSMRGWVRCSFRAYCGWTLSTQRANGKKHAERERVRSRKFKACSIG